MTEPPIFGELVQEQSPAPREAERTEKGAAHHTPSKSIDSAAGACLRLTRAGNLVAWGLLALGVVAGLDRVIPPAIDAEARQEPRLRAWVGAIFSVVAYGLAGLAVAAVTRMAAAAIGEYLERVARVSDDLLALTTRGVVDLDRISQVLSLGRQPQLPINQPALERTHKVEEIRRAIRISDWAVAESLLSAFAAEFPDDSQQTNLKAELKQSKYLASEQQLARLEAARQVNDPEGVFESYHHLAATLEAEARAALDQDLGKWFLALIHRRLRSAKIQPDVVQLASRFADAFASTVEGASVRASLPTLRRSAGLCPRCGSPYGGAGSACPKCLETMSLRPNQPDPAAQSSDSH
jgi:hypothetical protein